MFWQPPNYGWALLLLFLSALREGICDETQCCYVINVVVGLNWPNRWQQEWF